MTQQTSIDTNITNSDSVSRNNSITRKKGVTSLICVSHILTSWGDRMWGFAVGLYLVILYPDSLQYSAIYGFTTCACVIIGGPFIGKWVDRTSRFRAAVLSITIQNGAVAACAILLILMISYIDDVVPAWGNALFLLSIIVFAVAGELASVANKIAIERDWIVVLADNNQSKLSKMNAIMRTIDLTTSILAPAVVAQIIAFVSKTAGAAFIAGWNIISGVVEIYLLYNIFNSVPQLAQKNLGKAPEILVEPSTPTDPNIPMEGVNNESIIPTPTGSGTGLPSKDFDDVHLTPAMKIFTLSDHSLSPTQVSPAPFLSSSRLKLIENTKLTIYQKIVDSMKGWQDYFHHPVRFAGLGLSCLYMTVLGFDIITIGYIYSQGVSESFVGIIVPMGAISGILGSISFPFLRARLGKCAVGNFGFGFETLCLVLCVVSMFVSGSPFVPEDVWGPAPETEVFLSVTNTSLPQTIYDSTTSSENIGFESTTEFAEIFDYTSVFIFIAGIVASRFGILHSFVMDCMTIGLWIADLSVTQFFQEEVPEDKRGILNGVQDSLNQAMNLIKFVLVIVLPDPATFGYLICLSWIFVFLGWVCFMIFTCSWRRRSQKIGTTF